MPLSDYDVLESRIKRLKDIELAFVVGMPRSGTTWLQRMMHHHPQVCCRGESHFVSILYKELKKNLQDYNRIVRVQGGAIAHLSEFGGHVESLDINNKDMKLILGYAIAVMLSKWIKDEGVRVVAEKTPDNILWVGLLSEIFPKAKFIHLIRDGRDCAISFWFFNLKMAGKSRRIDESIEIFVNRYMKQWSTSISLARTVGNKLSEHYMEIHYEALVNEPNGSMKKVFDFFDVDNHPALIDGCIETESFHRLSGGRDRGNEDRNSFFRKGAIGDWKDYMDDDMQRRAWRVAGDQLQALGYKQS